MNVPRALDLDARRRLNVVRNLNPRFLQAHLEKFAGVEGSVPYNRFRDELMDYRRFVLRKRPEEVGDPAIRRSLRQTDLEKSAATAR